MRLNRTSEWKVMTIWISRELPLLNFERLYILYAKIWTPCENIWPFRFLERFRCWISSVSIYYAPELDLQVKSHDHSNFSSASVVQFRASRYIMHLNHTSIWKVMIIWNSREVPLLKNYDHFNFSRASVVQFRPSRYMMRLNWTSKWKVMTIWISLEILLFNFVRLDILCAWIGPPS